MRFATALLTLALAALLTPAAAQNMLPDGSIQLPFETEADPIRAANQRALSEQDAWQAFTAHNGSWLVQWNEATGTPQRAMGVARVPGFPTVSAATSEAAARAFVAQHADLLRATPADLELVKNVDAGDRFYVGFRQVHQGLPVLFSEVELALFANGNVPAFGAVIYDDIAVDRAAALSAEAAEAAATAGLDLAGRAHTTETDGHLYVLPVREGTAVSYRLVYEVWVQAEHGLWRTLVDAHDASIPYRINLVMPIHPGEDHAGHAGHSHGAPLAAELAGTLLPSRNAATGGAVQGTVTGSVFEVMPFNETPTQQPFPEQYVTVAGEQVTTDDDGTFTAPAAGPVSATLAGPWFRTLRQDGPNASFSGTAEAGSAFTLEWTNANSAANERNGYFHAMRARNHLRDLYEAHAGPGQLFTYINAQMPVNVGLEGSCNAFWNGTSINFYRAAGGCPDIALLASVVYHEYGHGVNQRIYNRLGAGSMGNRAANEATADVISTAIEDDPRVGRGFTGPNAVLRNCDNTRRYPQNYDSNTTLAAHYNNSRILCGAFWAVRQGVDLDTYRRLAHFTKYGTPDDPNTVVAFSEWFVALLVADDDDGDLTNGTPNFDAIVNAFNERGIGIDLLLPSSFNHTPLADTPVTDQPYTAVINVNQLAIQGGVLELVYSTDNFVTSTTVTPQPDPNVSGRYLADIPAQPEGTVVRYYVRAESAGGVEIILPAAAPDRGYTFLVGTFEQVLFDPLEGDFTAWYAGAPDDDATSGHWERADPDRVVFNNVEMQPGFDHTPGLGNVLAWVTGPLAGGSPFTHSVRGGKTTLFSPAYDLSNAGPNPVIRFYLWYVSFPNESDRFLIDLTGDGGETWTRIYESAKSTDGWELMTFAVTDYMEPTATMRLRFTAQDEPGTSIVEALVDDFEILVSPGGSVSADAGGAPLAFAFDAVYPNPAASAAGARAAFTLPAAADVSLEVFDLLGRRVATAAAGSMPAGRHDVSLPTAGLSAGPYVVRLRAGSDVATARLTVLP